VGYRVGYDIPKNVGMTMPMTKGRRGVPVFKVFRGDLSGLGVRTGLGLWTKGIRPFEIWEA